MPDIITPEPKISKPGELPPHISFSQVSTFMRCPKQYYYSYVEKLKQPPAFALNFGKAIHKGIEVNYAQKIETHKDLHIDEIKDAYNEEMKASKDILEDDATDHEDIKKWKEDYTGYYKQGFEMLDMYHEQIGKKTQPIIAEGKFEIPNEGGRNLLGYIDLVDDKNIVVDSKTAGSKYTQAKANNDLQLSAYFYALKKFFGLTPKGVRYDVMVKTKTPQIQQLSADRNEEQIRVAMALIKTVDTEISDCMKKGSFRENPGDACSWCGFAACVFNKRYVGKKIV